MPARAAIVAQALRCVARPQNTNPPPWKYRTVAPSSEPVATRGCVVISHGTPPSVTCSMLTRFGLGSMSTARSSLAMTLMPPSVSGHTLSVGFRVNRNAYARTLA